MADIIRILTAWYITVVLFSTSLLVNVIQLCVTLMFFIPQKTRISLCQQLANPWWELWVFIAECWGGVRYYFFGDKIPADECAILIGNHGPGLDFMTGVVISNRAANIGCGRLMTFLKASLQFMPSIGWTHYFQGSIFLKRNWQADQSAIQRKLAEIESNKFPRPFWLGIYPEGTRITPKKHEESLKFAAERGLPKLNHVLLPRTKGFVTLVQSLPTAIPALYDTTVAYKNGGFILTDPLFHGYWKCEEVYIHVKRIPFSTLPREEDGLNKWLMEDFTQKDKVLDHFETHKTFPGESVDYNEDYLHHRVVWTLWSTIFTGILYLSFGSNILTLLSLICQVLTLAVSTKSLSSSTSSSSKEKM